MKKPLLFLSFLVGITLAGMSAFAQTTITYPGGPSYTYTQGTSISALIPVTTGVTGVTGGYQPIVDFADLPGNPGGIFGIGARAALGNAITYDPVSGAFYAVDYANGYLNKITTAGVVTTLSTIMNNNEGSGIVVDGLGNIFISDNAANSVYEFNSAGTRINTITGFNSPSGLAVDANNNVYVVDAGNGSNGAGFIYKIAAGTTTRTTVLTNLSNPYGIAISGNDIYFTQYSTGTTTTSKNIIKVTGGVTGSTAQTIFVGNTAATVPFNNPRNLTFDANGNLFVSDYGNGKIEEISPTKVVTSILSTGLNNPSQVTFDPAGNLYVADFSNNTILESPFQKYSINKVLPAGLSFDTNTGIISGTPTVAQASTAYIVTAYSSNGNASVTINIAVSPIPPVISYSPNTYAFAINNAIPGTITPISGGGGAVANGAGYGAPQILTSTNISNPWGMAADASGNIYVVNNGNKTVTKYSSTGAISTFIASVPASPVGIAFDSNGNAYVLTATGLYKYNSSGVQSATVYSLITNATGIAIDASDNIYIAESSPTNNVKVYSVNGGTGTIKITPTGGATHNITGGITVDGAGFIYVAAGTSVDQYNSAFARQGTHFFTGASNNFQLNVDGSDNLYYAATTRLYYSNSVATNNFTGFTSARGTVTDIYGNLYVSDFSANTVTKYKPNSGYYLSGGPLPAGLSFDNTTGQFSGTPTTTFPPTTYTVTAYNSAGGGSTAITFSCGNVKVWHGTNTGNASWNTAANWNTPGVPGPFDIAYIGTETGTANSFLVIPSIPTGTTVNIGGIVMGTNNRSPVAPGVNAIGSLIVGGAITYQSDNNSDNTTVATFTGSGSISATNLIINADQLIFNDYTEKITSSVTTFKLSSNVSLTSNAVNILGFSLWEGDAAFNVTGGTTSIGGIIQTTNDGGSKSTISVIPTTTATLQLANTAALSGLSTNGTNVVSFKNPGATIDYSGIIAQTVYTDAAIPGLAAGPSYYSIKFSGSAIKTPNSGNLNVSGDFTNAIILNDANDYINFSATPVFFNGATQNLAGGNGIGTTFKNVTFNGTGLSTITGGNFYVSSTGVLTMAGTASLLAGTTTYPGVSYLTLNSDANGSAAVAKITTGTPISGNVNVQRYIHGDGNLLYRNYRYLSSPVHNTTSPVVLGTGYAYDLQYLKTSNPNYPITTGSTGTAGGFDKAGNPTIYVYREDRGVDNSVFSGGNFIGVANITGTQLVYDGANNPTASGYLPIGNGFDFFYRGTKDDLAGRTTTPITNPTNFPNSTTVTQTGFLNQGNVPVNIWFNNYQSSLSYTASNTSGSIGFNLVGNPYACAIDWNTAYAGNGAITRTTTAILPTIWVFNPLTKQYDTYITTGTGAGTGNPASTNSIIPSGQGFFVRTNAPNGKLTFTEAAKTSVSPTQSTLLMGLPAGQVAVQQLLRLKLAIDTINYDDIAIAFNSNASTTYNDQEDSKYLTGLSAPEGFASFSSDNTPLSINSLPLPQKDPLIIKLNVQATSSGALTIKKTQLDALPAIYEVWLMDKYKKDSLDLRNNANYAFTISKSDTASFGTNRFQIVIRQNQALGVHLLAFNALKVTNGVQNIWKVENEQNYTNFTLERSTDKGITYNVLDGFLSDAQGTYSYLDKNPGKFTDMYRLKIEDLDGNITYSKVVTIIYSNSGNDNITKNHISIYPNPARGIINLTIGEDVITTTNPNLSGYQTSTMPTLAASASTPAASSQSYDIKIINIIGYVVKTATSNQPSWQDNVSALLPGTYIIQVLNHSDKSLVGKSTFVKM